jgi:hypothetical protein
VKIGHNVEIATPLQAWQAERVEGEISKRLLVPGDCLLIVLNAR